LPNYCQKNVSPKNVSERFWKVREIFKKLEKPKKY
jgi:hypothetical protein